MYMYMYVYKHIAIRMLCWGKHCPESGATAAPWPARARPGVTLRAK